jgi:hypothetical protein
MLCGVDFQIGVEIKMRSRHFCCVRRDFFFSFRLFAIGLLRWRFSRLSLSASG